MTSAEANVKFAAGIVATITGGSVSIDQLLRGGSLLLTIAGGVVALLGGLYARKTRQIERRIREKEEELIDLRLKRARNGDVQ